MPLPNDTGRHDCRHPGGTYETRSDAVSNQRAYDGEQEEFGHRVLYVLAASLALAVIAMIAVALTA
jgi:hypothetical protein